MYRFSLLTWQYGGIDGGGSVPQELSIQTTVISIPHFGDKFSSLLFPIQENTKRASKMD
jgi:hypothetical protein